MASEKSDNYLMVAAIDFGTTYSGYAYSTRYEFQRDPTKVSLKLWEDPTSTMMYYKTSTCILFNKEKEFSKFGFEAEAKYLDLILDNDYEDWYFFRRFKMSLYELKSKDQELFIETENGKSMPALVVFSESIRYLQQSLIEKVKQGFEIEMADIRWVITVPAIWSDPAKAFMRTAAIQAGIDPAMLTIALEPEAAALYVKHLPIEKRLDTNKEMVLQAFAPGSKYIVVDAGGGTIDITAHEMMDDGHVKEIIKANGGNWGGTKVDEEYMDFIKCLIGEDTTKYINENLPSLFFEASRDFEIAKHTIKPNSDIKLNVKFPSQIGEIYTTLHPGKELKAKEIVLTKDKKQVAVLLRGDKLRLATKDAEDFFTQSVKNITDHLAKLLQQYDRKDISTIILVGGYAESPMLIERIQSSFPDMRIIIPLEAPWSILLGAVIFGHSPDLIKHRRSKYTYGICVNKKFNPSEHDEKHKYEENGEYRCGRLFSKLVEIDEIVSVRECMEIAKYFRIKNCKDEGNFKLYASTSRNPRYVDEEDCLFIGHILSPGHEFLPIHRIYIDAYFGETQITFLAYQPKSKKTVAFYLGQ